MVKDKKIEKLDNSAVKLTVTVAQDAVRKEYDTLLAHYAKSAQVKGFRKGKVPAAVLERKFGESIRFEASQKSLEAALKQVFDEIEERPLPYCTPSLEGEPDFSMASDLEFSVTYDTFPEVVLGSTEGLTVEEPVVAVTKEDENRELEQLQEQNAVVIEKDDEAIAEGHIVTMNYEELDESGAVIDGTRREDFTFTVGSGYNLFALDEDVKGLKKGQTKVIKKTFADDYQHEELRGQSKTIQVEIKAVKVKDLPKLDDELAQDVSEKYETLDDLKKDIQKKLQKNLETRLEQMKVDQVMDALIESSTVPVPASMLQAELQNSWQRFVQQFRAPEEQVMQLLQMQGKTKDELLDEWRGAAEKNLKRSLITQKLIELEKIEVSDEELDAELNEHAEQSGTSVAEIKEYFEKQGMLPYLKQDLQERKAHKAVLAKAKSKKGKKMSYLDAMQSNA